MEDKIETADKKVLVDIVKFVQKRGLRDELGCWKEFLNCHDKRFGANLSDPSKYSKAVLGCEVREKFVLHNCLDDALAAMNLVLAKIKDDVDKEFPISFVQEHDPKSEMANNFLTRYQH